MIYFVGMNGVFFMKNESVVIITGANSGLGKAAAMQLCQMGAHVVLVCRNAQRGERALLDIRAKTGGSAELMLCDLASLKSVEEFCRNFYAKHDRLDVLINNAGTIQKNRCETGDGMEMCFQINYLAHFLLTNRLLPMLKHSAPARIIHVSSIAHRFAKLDFDDIGMIKGYNWWRGYARSKLAIVTSANLLAKKLMGTGVTVNCIHPGVVGTDITASHESGKGAVIAHFHRMLFMSAEKGAAPIVRLATDPAFEGVTGKYFSLGTEKTPAARAADADAAERLWELSEHMCHLG
jgi:NAD(P)-dependent dehydrogenase (short-subunit alcohol dehydrogenase family)